MNFSFSQATDPIRIPNNNYSSGLGRGGGVLSLSAASGGGGGGGSGTRKKMWIYLYGFVSALGVSEILFIALGWFFVFRKENKPASLLEQGYKMISSQFRKYTYRELSKATNKFKDELGRGAFSVVYKGILDNVRAVAVKKMEDATQWSSHWMVVRIFHCKQVISHRVRLSCKYEVNFLEHHFIYNSEVIEVCFFFEEK